MNMGSRKAQFLLRYPGGKQRAVPKLLPLIPDDTTELHSPFFGGGSIELAWLAGARARRLVASDIFEPLASFWSTVFGGHQSQVADEVEKHFPINKALFKELQARLKSDGGTTLERAAWFYVINRASFSGATLSGGMGGGDRFTATSIDRLRKFKHSGVVDFRQADAFELLEDDSRRYLAPGVCIFADPPYLLKVNNLYGVRGSTHKNFDHARLAAALKRLSDKGARIVMTYNNDPEIRALYGDAEGFRTVTVKWSYGMGIHKDGKELIFISKQLAATLNDSKTTIQTVWQDQPVLSALRPALCIQKVKP